MKLKTLLALLLLCFFQNAEAQKSMEETPEWIMMMNDPNTNYFKAVETFNSYWKNREKPTEEKEIFEEKKSKIKEYKNEKTLQYAFEYKKFLKWQKQMLPYVQEDGRILTKKERMEIWEKEKNSRN
nr:hypothetical protein [uncultured Flavobacterium sp.]